jgi:hypothetical protein
MVSEQVNFRLPAALLKRLDSFAAERGIRRTEVVGEI